MCGFSFLYEVFCNILEKTRLEGLQSEINVLFAAYVCQSLVVGYLTHLFVFNFTKVLNS